MALTDPEIAVALAATAILGAMAYWAVRRRRSLAAGQAVQARQSDDPADKTRRMLLRGERPSPIPNVAVWKAAREAVEAYADPELRQAREHWALKSRTASENESEAERQIKEIRDKFPDGVVPKESDVWPELEQAEQRQRSSAFIAINSEEEVRQLAVDIHADVYRKLCLGKLIAKGLREPRAAGSSEVQILPTEWRALMLHHLEDKAVQRGIDGKLVYSGLVIGKAS